MLNLWCANAWWWPEEVKLMMWILTGFLSDSLQLEGDSPSLFSMENLVRHAFLTGTIGYLTVMYHCWAWNLIHSFLMIMFYGFGCRCLWRFAGALAMKRDTASDALSQCYVLFCIMVPGMWMNYPLLYYNSWTSENNGNYSSVFIFWWLV